MKRHYLPLVFSLLLAVLILAEDEDDDAKPIYVAPKFVRPTVTGSPLLVDWFEDVDALDKKWIRSRGKKDDVEDSIAKYNGEWEIGSPTKKVIDGDMGLIVKTKARHHAIATKFSRPFTFDGKPLIAQYEVKYEEGQECGGGYIKLLSTGAEKKLSEFTDKTPYTIMFGPDRCGQNVKVHFIVRFTNPKSGVITEHHAKQSNKPISSYFDDRRSHLYTLIVHPNDKFQVLVDNYEIMSGSLLTDLEPSITPPATIDDPDDKKPADWDEREMIDDPDARKPDDWDEDAPKEIEDKSAVKPADWLEEEPVHIHDPAAKKPDDWDDELDQQWEAPLIPNPKCKDVSGCGPWKRPMIANPNYKGKWKTPRISNPAYKGKWSPRQIENPNYFEAHPYKQMTPISALGIELWTMSANIIIDNIYVGDDVDAAASFASQTFSLKQTQESAYENVMSPNGGVLHHLVSATEERPWLWAVYVLAVLVPVVVIALVCFGRKSRSPAADYKKTDEPQPDDEVPDLVGDEEEPADAVTEEKQAEDGKRESDSETRNRSKSPARKQRAAAKTKVDLEKDNESASQEGSAAEDDGAVAGTSSPKGKRVRQRRQD
uniref:Calnexin n=1 Tax=Ascaris lumbricoides TaxID=6252 RepID=A0A9J2NZP7_ASCLU